MKGDQSEKNKVIIVYLFVDFLFPFLYDKKKLFVNEEEKMYRVAFFNLDEFGRHLLQALVMNQRDDIEVPLVNEPNGLSWRKNSLEKEMREINPACCLSQDEKSLEYNGLRMNFYQERDFSKLPLKEMDINTVVCSNPTMEYSRQEVTSFLKTGIKKLIYISNNEEKSEIHIYKNKGTVEKPKIKSYRLPFFFGKQFFMLFPRKKDDRVRVFINGTTPFARFFFKEAKNHPVFKVSMVMDDVLSKKDGVFMIDSNDKDLDKFYNEEMIFYSQRKNQRILKDKNVYKTFKPEVVLNFKEFSWDDLIVLSQYYHSKKTDTLISFLPDGQLTVFEVGGGKVWQVKLEEKDIKDSPVLSFIMKQKERFELLNSSQNETEKENKVQVPTGKNAGVKAQGGVAASVLSKNIQNQRE